VGAGEVGRERIGGVFHGPIEPYFWRKIVSKQRPESIGRSHPAASGRHVFCGMRQSMPERR
jgi:hypothetical protein